MSTLITGSRGMLGRALRELFERENRPYLAVDLGELDITDAAAVKAYFAKEQPKLVLNCAAYTQVDGAETDEATATLVNGKAVRTLAEACAEHQALLVHYSTDYVFAGDASAPYRVDEPLAPLNAFGRSKAVGEQAIREVGAAHLILRTSWLYAPWAANFVRTIHKLARERPMLKVVDDQRGRPTSAEHLAEITMALVAARARGTLHVTDGGECTWFEFASEIVRLSGDAASNCRVEPCTSAEFPRPAKRPAYSVLDLAPTEALVGPMTSWQENLADVMDRLE
jgi:dTDP-4-dehydrorhamnose reductase